MLLTVSRLSDLFIKDDCVRTELYKRIINYIADASNSSNLILYEIKTDERHRPDLVSYRAYGLSDMGWLVTLVSGLDDPLDALPVGFDIALPPVSFVRSAIREVSAMERH